MYSTGSSEGSTRFLNRGDRLGPRVSPGERTTMCPTTPECAPRGASTAVT